jgi:hypothetical protein
VAVRARFGRLPRSAPSLTATIVALAEQWQRAREGNIEDAWKNGGLFEGHKVTDAEFLKFWKDKLAETDQNDPKWDELNNRIYGYEFLIEETDMGLKYAREDVSEAQMAAFYAKWAGKMPRNSQNWRLLMTQSAKFKAAASARSAGRRASGAKDAYNAKQQATFLKHEQAANVANSLIAQYALNAGILDRADVQQPDYGWSKLTNAAGENDPTNFSNLLVDLNNSPAGAYIAAEIRKYDPSFDGTFTAESMNRLSDNARNGASIRLNRANKVGDKTGAKEAAKSMDRYSLQSFIVRSTLSNDPHGGFVSQNEFYRTRLDSVIADMSASPLDRVAAVEEYANWLGGSGSQLYAKSFPAGSLDPASPNYDVYAGGTWGRITNTLNSLQGKATGQTLKDDTFGFSVSEAGTTSDAMKLAETVNYYNGAMESIASGESIVVRSDETGRPDANGTSWTVFDRGNKDIADLDLIPMVSASHGSYRGPGLYGNALGGAEGEVRYSIAKPIVVRSYSATDPNTGAMLDQYASDKTADEVVGTVLQMPTDNGTTIPVYGIWVNGTRRWTTVDPFVAGGAKTVEPDGTVVYGYNAGARQYDSKGKEIKAAPFIPATAINGAVLQTSSYDSPMYAMLHASSEHAKYIASLGDKAIVNGERAWYSNQSNWTADMNAKVAQGFDPAVVVEQKAQETVTTAQNYHYWGENPENTRFAMQRRSEAQTDENMIRRGLEQRAGSGKTRRDDIPTPEERNAQLRSNVDQWREGIDRPFGSALQPTGLGAGIGQQSVQSMVNQPGMSLAQSSDLVYQITGGKNGRSLNAPRDQTRMQRRATSRMPWLTPAPAPAQQIGAPPATGFVTPRGPKPTPAPTGPAAGPTANRPPVMYGPPLPNYILNASRGTSGPAAGPNAAKYPTTTTTRRGRR